MSTSKIPQSSWQQALKFINKCPLCTEPYDPKKAHLFAKNEAAHLVHLTCSKCSSYFIVMILMMGHGLSSVGMVTDLSLADAERLYKAEPITLNEAINGYKLIGKNRFNSLIFNRK